MRLQYERIFPSLLQMDVKEASINIQEKGFVININRIPEECFSLKYNIQCYSILNFNRVNIELPADSYFIYFFNENLYFLNQTKLKTDLSFLIDEILTRVDFLNS